MRKVWQCIKLMVLAVFWLAAYQVMLAFHLPDLVGNLQAEALSQYDPVSVQGSIEYWNVIPSINITWSVVLSVATLSVALLLPKQRRLAMALIMVVVARHLYWRLTSTINFEDPASAFFGTLLMLAELYGAISIVLGCIQMYRPIIRKAPKEAFYKGFAPTVDILIPTYSEPVEVLNRTILGCMAVSYPGKKVYVLDDGNRPEIRDLCQELGCFYITRKDNRHAKAGNLNNALKHCHGELVVVFDADHVPLRNFLQKTVPYFIDPKLAFVQTPQHFCSPDPFERNLITQGDLGNEQDLFYHVIMPGMDHLGAVTFAGSGTVFRRKALDEIGGFAVETITEDLHTGLRLHDRGWKSIYVNEDLASGLAPESFEDFLIQRMRWCRGAIQIFRKEDILGMKTLTWAQKLSYFNALWYFFQGIPRVIFLFAPLIYLLFGIATIHAYYLEVASYYLCYFLVTSTAYTQITGNSRQTQWSELYETALCFHLSVVTVLTWLNPHKASFKVTPKGKINDRISCNFALIAPHVAMFGLCVLGLGLGVARAKADPEMVGLILWNFAWTGYNMFLLLCAMLASINRPQKRLFPRIARKIPLEVRTSLGFTRGEIAVISQGGATIVMDKPVPVRSALEVTIQDNKLGLSTKMPARVIHSQILSDGKHQVNVRFVDLTKEMEKNLILHTYTAENTWQDYHRITPPAQSILKLIQTPFRWLKTREQAKFRFAPRFAIERPCVILDQDNRFLHFGNIVNLSESGARLELPPSTGTLPVMGTYKMVFHWHQNSVEELVIQVVSQQSGPHEKQSVGVIFPALNDVQLNRLYKHLYKKHTRPIDFVDVQESRNYLHEYLSEHWDIDLSMVFEKEPLKVATAQQN